MLHCPSGPNAADLSFTETNQSNYNQKSDALLEEMSRVLCKTLFIQDALPGNVRDIMVQHCADVKYIKNKHLHVKSEREVLDVLKQLLLL